MSGYAGSPSGYLNPVAVDKIQQHREQIREQIGRGKGVTITFKSQVSKMN